MDTAITKFNGFGLLLVGIGLVLVSSCTPVVKRLYGINEITSFDSVAYEKTIREINDDYPGDIQFVVCDTTQYKKYGELDFGGYSHALRQPIQILYFQKDTLLSYHANCFAKGGLTNIDWNVNNRFEHFIPKSGECKINCVNV